MARRAAVLLLLALAGPALGAPAAPSPSPLDVAIARSAEHLFGPARGDYFHPQGLVWRQVLEGLGRPRDPVRALGEGEILSAGCLEPKHCREKAAVITTRSGKVVAAALVHFHCVANTLKGIKHRTPRCGQARTLTIFLTPSPKRGAYEAAFTDWAQRRGGYDLKAINPLG